MGQHYASYKLSDETKNMILSAFPPRYESVIADHITVAFGVNADYPLPPENPHIEIIGHADDRNGIEALVVAVNGTTERPDGKTYHITLSLDPEKKAPKEFDIFAKPGKEKEKPYKPVHSNALIERLGYDPVAVDIDIQVTPEISGQAKNQDQARTNVSALTAATQPRISNG